MKNLFLDLISNLDIIPFDIRLKIPTQKIILKSKKIISVSSWYENSLMRAYDKAKNTKVRMFCVENR